jgi:hypothetical protein
MTDEPMNSNDEPVPATDEPTAQVETSGQEVRISSRRRFLGGSARKLAYAAPVVMLFRPEPACASAVSQASGG